MAPRTRPNPQPLRPSAEDDADIRVGLAELDRAEGVELTADELRHWAETGEWPERLDGARGFSRDSALGFVKHSPESRAIARALQLHRGHPFAAPHPGA